MKNQIFFSGKTADPNINLYTLRLLLQSPEPEDRITKLTVGGEVQDHRWAFCFTDKDECKQECYIVFSFFPRCNWVSVHVETEQGEVEIALFLPEVHKGAGHGS